MNAPSKHQTGFTRIEIAVVIAIVAAVVAVVAIPNHSLSRRSPVNACINNLRQIDAIKQIWAINQNITNLTVTPTLSDLTSHAGHSWENGFAPYCPLDKKRTFESSYIINNLKTPPQCRFSGTHTNHVLPPD